MHTQCTVHIMYIVEIYYTCKAPISHSQLTPLCSISFCNVYQLTAPYTIHANECIYTARVSVHRAWIYTIYTVQECVRLQQSHHQQQQHVEITITMCILFRTVRIPIFSDFCTTYSFWAGVTCVYCIYVQIYRL